MLTGRSLEYSFKGIVASLDAVIGSCPPVLQRDWQRRKHNEDSRLIREEREAAYRISLESDALKVRCIWSSSKQSRCAPAHAYVYLPAMYCAKEMKLKQKINKKTQKEHSDSLKIKAYRAYSRLTAISYC